MPILSEIGGIVTSHRSTRPIADEVDSIPALARSSHDAAELPKSRIHLNLFPSLISEREIRQNLGEAINRGYPHVYLSYVSGFQEILLRQPRRQARQREM